MKRSSFYFRFYTLAAIMTILLGVLVARLWVVQILEGAKYASKIENRSQVTVRLPAVRGEILDRNGIKLVENAACYEVDFYLPAMVKAYRDKHEGKVPITEYRGRVRGMLRTKKAADMELIIRDEVIPRLESLGLAQDYNSQRLQTHYQDNSEIPFNYRQNIDYDTMVRYMENNVGLPGVEIGIKPMRHYIYGSLAAHLLGYVGAPIDHDPAEVAKYNYFQPDIVGKSQVELFYDSYLRGKAGAKVLDRDVKGVIKGELKRIEPTQGANVYLTIDARLQFVVEQTLRNIGRGSAVVIDPNSGDVLAMASVPAFDPNTFIPSISGTDWSALQKNLAKPLVNRAISAYAPGSTYKVPISLAGLRAGIGSRTFSCSGGVQYGNFFMKCWQKNGHGSLSLETALKVSCNAFFYQYGNAAGIENIVAVGNMLGLGQKSGLPLSGEVPGILPGPEWLAQNYPRERWSSGYTANTSIGQGFVLVSPLQMAVVAASVANGGTVYYPRLVEKVVTQDGTVLLQEPAKVRADLKTDAGLTAADIERVRRGMWEVVNEGGGTGGRARSKDIQVAGKTGTAQNWIVRDGRRVQDNLVWFVSFAPYDNPKYAICVMVEGGEAGGRVAAPIAGEIYKQALAIESGAEEVKIEPLPPTEGNFKHVDLVDFGNPIPAALSEDGDTGDTGQAPQVAAQTAQGGAPTIKPDADDRGRVKNQPARNAVQRFFDIFGGRKDADKPREKRKPNPGRP